MSAEGSSYETSAFTQEFLLSPDSVDLSNLARVSGPARRCGCWSLKPALND